MNSNLAGSKQLSTDETGLVGIQFHTLIRKSEVARFHELMRGVFSSGDRKNGEFRLESSSKMPSMIQFIAIRSPDKDDECFAVVVECSESSNDKKLLGEILSNTSEGIHIVKNSDGCFHYVNRGLEKILGYGPGELDGKHVSTINHPGQLTPEETAVHVFAHLEKYGSWQGDIQNRRKDGTPVWSHAHVMPFDHHEMGKVWLTIHEDISERKKAEEDLRSSREHLRSLLARLHHVQEAERIRISREIHDELGQLLTGIQLDLHWLGTQLKELATPDRLPSLMEKMASVGELTRNAMAAVQKIASELRPASLDRLGIVAALKEKAQRFTDRTKIPCGTFFSDPLIAIDMDIATEFYYICREALTNISRHALATHVEIRLEVIKERLVLSVVDDGVGIPPEGLNSNSSLGILGMKERALLIGAEFAINLGVSSGTIVTVSIPVTEALASKVDIA